MHSQPRIHFEFGTMSSKSRIQNEFMAANAFEARMHSGFGLIGPPIRITNEFKAANAFAAMNSFWILDFEGIHSQEFILNSGLRMHSHEFVYDAGIFV